MLGEDRIVDWETDDGLCSKEEINAGCDGALNGDALVGGDPLIDSDALGGGGVPSSDGVLSGGGVLGGEDGMEAPN